METLNNKEHLIHVRTKIITMWSNKCKTREIIEETGCSPSVINKWIKRYQQMGEVGLMDRRVGNQRPRKTTPDDAVRLYDIAKANNFKSSESFAAIANLQISGRTVRRILKEQGLINGRTSKKFALTEAQRDCRVQHCNDHLDWTTEQWGNVIWSDETNFKSTTTNKGRVWREKNSRFEPENVVPIDKSHRVSSMYWGCMSSAGLMTLQKLDLPFNSLKYRELLNNVMYPAARARFPLEQYPVITFMQDNSPIHTAGIITEWFREHPDVRLLHHPPYSPDLNPIENIWSLVTKKWSPENRITNQNQLDAYINLVWDELATRPDYCSNLLKTYRQRLLNVIACKGYWTKY